MWMRCEYCGNEADAIDGGCCKCGAPKRRYGNMDGMVEVTAFGDRQRSFIGMYAGTAGYPYSGGSCLPVNEWVDASSGPSPMMPPCGVPIERWRE